MMRWLDQITGRATMYRLILIGLLALVAEALLVSLTGQLAPYSALGILVSVGLAVTLSYLGNRLFALIFRVRPHSESSLITGLILGLLFLPILDGAHLASIAVAAITASASKYLLAVRRRHVFNPAAVGAFVAGLIFPLDGAGWWMATAWLLPITALGAFVILFRTRHLAMGIVFVVVSAGIVVTIILTMNEATAPMALDTALVSFPIVFFAGFMLSEPLTLPPRRWQQLVEAVVVAILFGLETIGFHLGPIYASPLIALLVGNLLAFLVGQRHGIRLEYLGRKQLSATSWELSFRPRRPPRFIPGQFMELTLPHSGADVRGLRRTFSIASAPGGDIVRFGIRTAEKSSSFKRALLGLEAGEVVTASAVGGDFVLPRNPRRPVLFVAGGIGITPFMSHLEQEVGAIEKRDIVVVYSASSGDELAYSERLRKLGTRVLIVAATAPTPLPKEWTYLGAGPLTAESLTAAVPDVASRAALVSGPPVFVHSLRRVLRGAKARSVRADLFTGYGTKSTPRVARPATRPDSADPK